MELRANGEVHFLRRSDGSRLRYFTTRTGPPLVVLHTVGTRLDYFQRVLPALSGEFTVYALDLPGMGWSDIVPGAHYGQPELCGAVVEFIETLGLHGATLAGESIGASIALLTSIELTARVCNVVAVNPLRLSERPGTRELVRTGDRDRHPPARLGPGVHPPGKPHDPADRAARRLQRRPRVARKASLTSCAEAAAGPATPG